MNTDRPRASSDWKSNLEQGRCQGGGLQYGFKVGRSKSADIPTTATTEIEAQTNTELHTNFCSLRLHVINLHSTPGKMNPFNPGSVFARFLYLHAHDVVTMYANTTTIEAFYSIFSSILSVYF